MNCKQIQEIILTDYIDARLEDKSAYFINQHLSQCVDCKAFLTDIKKSVVDPIKNASKTLPEGLLWSKVKQAIEKQQEELLEKSLTPGWWERLKSTVHFPRPAFALASLITMVFMIGISGQFFVNNMPIKINGQDQIQYLSSLMDEPGDISSNSNDNPTAIEKYFL